MRHISQATAHLTAYLLEDGRSRIEILNSFLIGHRSLFSESGAGAQDGG